MVALDQGWTMGTEMLSGILVLAGLGWLVDRWLGTTPWLFAVGALLGFAAGLYLVWLRAGRMDAAEQAERDQRHG
jgi:ATP synthase protein I